MADGFKILRMKKKNQILQHTLHNMHSYEKMQKLNETEKFKFKLYRTIECLRK